MLRKDAITFLLVIIWGIYVLFFLPMTEMNKTILIKDFTISMIVLAACLLILLIAACVSMKFRTWLCKKF